MSSVFKPGDPASVRAAGLVKVDDAAEWIRTMVGPQCHKQFRERFGGAS